MKRRALQIVVLLVLGAIVNVAVAWGMIQITEADFNHRRAQIASRSVDPDFKYVGWTIERVRYFGSETTLSRWGSRSRGNIGGLRDFEVPERLVPNWATELSPTSWELQPSSKVSVVARADGWPAYAFVGVLGVVERLNVQQQLVIRGVLCPTSLSYAASNKVNFLPWHPLWPGFAINTIFYAAMLWVVFFVPGMVRRRIRRRRGLCPACAYPIGTSPVCTECGKAVPQQREDQAG